MNHTELVDQAFKLPALKEYDYEIIDALPDSTLRQLLGIHDPVARAQPVKNKPRKTKLRLRRAERVAVDFVEKNGQLMRRETWRTFDAESIATYQEIDIRCGNRVTWCGNVVSASIVLHYLRTGETVARAPRADKKLFKAAVRVGAKVKHLGYFASMEERDAAVLTFRLTQRVREST